MSPNTPHCDTDYIGTISLSTLSIGPTSVRVNTTSLKCGVGPLCLGES